LLTDKSDRSIGRSLYSRDGRTPWMTDMTRTTMALRAYPIRAPSWNLGHAMPAWRTVSPVEPPGWTVAGDRLPARPRTRPESPQLYQTTLHDPPPPPAPLRFRRAPRPVIACCAMDRTPSGQSVFARSQSLNGQPASWSVADKTSAVQLQEADKPSLGQTDRESCD